MAEGRKYLQKQLDDAHKKYRASIEHLKGMNSVLSRERDSYKNEIISIADGKLLPSIKKLMKIRKDYKTIKK